MSTKEIKLEGAKDSYLSSFDSPTMIEGKFETRKIYQIGQTKMKDGSFWDTTQFSSKDDLRKFAESILNNLDNL